MSSLFGPPPTVYDVVNTLVPTVSLVVEVSALSAAWTRQAGVLLGVAVGVAVGVCVGVLVGRDVGVCVGE